MESATAAGPPTARWIDNLVGAKTAADVFG